MRALCKKCSRDSGNYYLILSIASYNVFAFARNSNDQNNLTHYVPGGNSQSNYQYSKHILSSTLTIFLFDFRSILA